MSDLKIMNVDGSFVTIDENTINDFKSSLRGTLLTKDDEGYNESRTIWNAMIDRKPGLIVQCTGSEDVQSAVRFASAHNLLVAIKGAGHNIAGNAVCNDGMMIDLSNMKDVNVDNQNKRAHVEPGVTLAELDKATQEHGLAVPVGINSTTGIAGLTLGGGFGWISRKYGLTLDSLVEVDIVSAAGELLKANKNENSDLFWGLRGGGGNFGVVTRFEFELHNVGPEIFGGLIVFPLSDAKNALTKFREVTKTFTDDTCVWVVLRQAPPLPFLPEDVHGTEVIVFAICHIGDQDAGAKAIEPIRAFGNPVGEHVGPMPFTAWQQAFDPLLTPGARNYWKSHNFAELEDGLIDTAIEYTNTLPSPQCEIFFALLGGEINRKDVDSTAYPHREANYTMNVHGRWDDASEDHKCIKWSREYSDATEQYATGGVYINFMTEDETGRIGDGFGKSMERLKEIKRKYDPKNLFRMNQNIKP